MSRTGKSKSENAGKSSQFKNAALRAGVEVQSGKGAIKGEYRAAISASSPWTHSESLDLDAHFENSEPRACRWDYGVGVQHGNAELVVWIEPHPASSTGEVKRIVEKVRWLKDKLDLPIFNELKALTEATVGKGHRPYRWLHAGSLRIAPGSKEARVLAQEGVEFPSRRIKLPA